MAERPGLALFALSMAAVGVVAAYLLLNLKGNIGFALELRGVRVAGLVVVAIAVSVSTVMFQTITGNHILTPAIMGFDALYACGQIALVFALGAVGFSTLDPRLKFGGETALMIVFALGFVLPMVRSRFDMTQTLLAGVVLGVLLRSLSHLLARLVDPNDYAVAQGASFASFGGLRTDLLTVAAVLTAAGAAIAWRKRNVLDIMALGADSATGLGLDWRNAVAGFMALTAALVAVSTALVGPVVFLGLLVVALAERLVATRRHAVLLPAAALVAIVVLVGGQAILQHGLGGASALGIVVEFVGGIVFLALLTLGRKR